MPRVGLLRTLMWSVSGLGKWGGARAYRIATADLQIVKLFFLLTYIFLFASFIRTRNRAPLCGCKG
jgi:hypothetical protein